MLNISQQQAEQRFSNISPILQDELFSGRNAKELYYLCRENQLNSEQMDMLSTIVGDVIFGFLSLNNLQQEIKNNLKLDDIKARTIEREINQKVFAHLRGDLEKNYNPILPELVQSGAEGTEKTLPTPAQIPSRPIVQGGTMPHVPMQKSFRDFIKRKPGEPIPETATPKIESKPVIDLGSFEIKGAGLKTVPAEKITLKVETPAEPATPFILHQHDQQEIGQSPLKKFSIKPELNVRVENYYQSPEPKKSAITARVELPQGPTNNKQQTTDNRQSVTNSGLVINNGSFGIAQDRSFGIAPWPGRQDKKTRVVHYDGYRTPLNNAGLPQSFSLTPKKDPTINNLPANPILGRELFSPPPKTTVLPATQALRHSSGQALRQSSGQARTQEIPKENKVDLRKFSKSDENTVDLRKKS